VGSALRWDDSVTHKTDQVFVMRFWHEHESPGDEDRESSRRWRVRITHVNDGRERYAKSIEEAFAIVRSLLLTEKPRH
jgi:hypothetical protein